MKRLFASLLTVVVLFPLPALAAYLASDVIGHADEDGDPLFIQSERYGGISPVGFSGAGESVVDPTGHRLFVVDESNRRVKVYNLDSSNDLIDNIADNVLGQADLYRRAATTPTRSNLGLATGVAFDDANNRLFVSDFTNNRVLVFDVSTVTDGEDAINVIGVGDYTTVGTGTGQAGVQPFGLAYDATDQRLFVSTTNGTRRIMVFDVDPATLVANNSGSDGPNAVALIGQIDYTTNVNAIDKRHIDGSQSVAYDDANDLLFVDDNNGRILVFDSSIANLASEAAGAGVATDAIYVIGETSFTTSGAAVTARSFLSPRGVALDEPGDRLFVTDLAGNRMLVFDVSLANLASEAIGNGTATDAVNVLGQPDFTTSTAPTVYSSTTMQDPPYIHYDASTDTLYVADISGRRLLVFDAGTITDNEPAVDILGQTDEDGNTSFTYGGENNTPNAIGFNRAEGLTIDTAGHRMFTTDSLAHRILMFDLDDDNQLVDRTAEVVIGQGDFKDDDSGVGQASLSAPFESLYLEDTDQLVVADRNNDRVLVFDVSSPTKGMDADLVIGDSTFTDDNPGTAVNLMSSPTGVCLDPDNDILFVVDRDNHRVLGFDLDSLASGMDATYVIGQVDFDTGTSGTTQRTFSSPRKCVFDAAGDRLFVADRNNSRIMVFDVSLANLASEAMGLGVAMDAMNVIGQTIFTSSTTATTISGLRRPIDVEYDSATHRLFVLDEQNIRVVAYDVSAITNGEDAVAVLGQDDFTSDDAGITQSQFDFDGSASLFFDEDNNRLYVGDDPRRYMVFDFVNITTTTLANAETGTSYNASIAKENDQGTVTFSLASGSLPPGLTVGSLSGTPTTPGTYTFSLKATDNNGAIGSFIDVRSYTMTVTQGTGSGGGGSGSGFIQPSTPTPGAQPSPADVGLREGDTISAYPYGDPDVYVINENGFKRLILNPAIFGFYGHLNYAGIKRITTSIRDAFTTSGLYRECESGDQKVYGLGVSGEDTGVLHHVNLSGTDAVAQDPNFFKKVFCINNREFNWYPKSLAPYMSLDQIPVYRR